MGLSGGQKDGGETRSRASAKYLRRALQDISFYERKAVFART